MTLIIISLHILRQSCNTLKLQENIFLGINFYIYVKKYSRKSLLFRILQISSLQYAFFLSFVNKPILFADNTTTKTNFWHCSCCLNLTKENKR